MYSRGQSGAGAPAGAGPTGMPPSGPGGINSSKSASEYSGYGGYGIYSFILFATKKMFVQFGIMSIQFPVPDKSSQVKLTLFRVSTEMSGH